MNESSFLTGNLVDQLKETLRDPVDVGCVLLLAFCAGALITLAMSA